MSRLRIALRCSASSRTVGAGPSKPTLVPASRALWRDDGGVGLGQRGFRTLVTASGVSTESEMDPSGGGAGVDGTTAGDL